MRFVIVRVGFNGKDYYYRVVGLGLGIGFGMTNLQNNEMSTVPSICSLF